MLKTTDVIFLKKEICRGKKQGKIASIFSTHLCTHTHTHTCKEHNLLTALQWKNNVYGNESWQRIAFQF